MVAVVRFRHFINAFHSINRLVGRYSGGGRGRGGGGGGGRYGGGGGGGYDGGYGGRGGGGGDRW